MKNIELSENYHYQRNYVVFIMKVMMSNEEEGLHTRKRRKIREFEKGSKNVLHQ